MLDSVQKDGYVLSKGFSCIEGVHIPEHVSGFINERGLYEEFPDHKKRYTKDCTPVYDEHGRLRFPGGRRIPLGTVGID